MARTLRLRRRRTTEVISDRRNQAGEVRKRLPRAAILLTGLALLPACGGTGEPMPERVILARHAEARRNVAPAFLAAFDALHATIEDGEDVVARQILDSILARRPPAHLVEFAQGYERILDGRALVRDVELKLVSERVGGSELDHRLVFEASHRRQGDVVLHIPPSSLRRNLVGIDPAGNESKSLSTEVTRILENMTVPAGEVVRIPLLDYELPVGGGLAIRERWTLDLRAGQFEHNGETLPAQNPPVAAAERTRIARFLPTDAVDPAELLRYVRAEEVYLPPLIERAVRIDPERRDETLDLLTPEVLRLAEEDPERLERIAPALRWLARTGRHGNQASLWSAWFEARANPDDPIDSPVLDLPDENLTR